MAARTRLIVTLYVHCLSCIIFSALWGFFSSWLAPESVIFSKLRLHEGKLSASEGLSTTLSNETRSLVQRSLLRTLQYESVLTFWSLLVTWCTNKFNIQQLYALPTLYLCFVFIWEQTATCATYIINWLVFITELYSVYSAVRTGSLNKEVCASSLKSLNWGTLKWLQSVYNSAYTVCPRFYYSVRGLTRTPTHVWNIEQRFHGADRHNFALQYIQNTNALTYGRKLIGLSRSHFSAPLAACRGTRFAYFEDSVRLGYDAASVDQPVADGAEWHTVSSLNFKTKALCSS
jgi:hypothetical protein